MTHVVAPLKRMDRGNVFHAYALRSKLIAPFLGVDHAWMSGPTFPPHPHAGFSAVSYLFVDAETGIRNRDSIGTENLIQPGGLHWAAAGSGIFHEEVPAEPGKTVHSLQIFVDLPPHRRDSEPFALSLEPQDVPVVQSSGVRVRVPLGSFGNVRSPLQPPTKVTLLDIALEEGAELAIPIPAGHRAFFLPVLGSVEVDGQSFSANDAGAPTFPVQDAPTSITLQARSGSAQAVVFSAEPLPSW